MFVVCCHVRARVTHKASSARALAREVCHTRFGYHPNQSGWFLPHTPLTPKPTQNSPPWTVGACAQAMRNTVVSPECAVLKSLVNNLQREASLGTMLRGYVYGCVLSVVQVSVRPPRRPPVFTAWVGGVRHLVAQHVHGP